ncbi:MAG: DinB family protein [Terracidiphilus sp.]
MSELNPYNKFLDGRPLEVILGSTASEIERLTKAIGPEKVSLAPAPGKWSPAEIVAHLADCELVFAFRLRQTLAEDSPVIQPFDQDKWAATYSGISATQAIEVFTAMRKWNLRLISLALPNSAKRPVTHPERGVMTFLTLVETMAGHDLNHLGQLRRLAQAA